MILARSLASAYPNGCAVPPHRHPWPQLVHATHGALEVRARRRLWVIPPARALWMPAGVEHSLVAAGATRLATLYPAPQLASGLPTEPTALEVSPLLAVLLGELVDSVPIERDPPRRRRRLWVVLDELRAAPTLATRLRLPEDARALRLAEDWIAGRGAGESLAEAGRRVGASARTLQRAFADTGLRVGEWRQCARLLRSLHAIDVGGGVAAMAELAGYRSVSAYTAAFRRTFGRTPGDFLHRRR